MKVLSIGLFFLSGCTMSFQPFPAAVTRAEVAEAFKQRDDNILAVAQAVKKLQKPEEEKQ